MKGWGILIGLVALSFTACDNPPGDDGEELITGYVNLQGGARFRPCNSPEQVWTISDNTGKLERLYTHLSINGTEGSWLFMQCHGRVDSSTDSRSRLTISQLDDLSARHYNNSCIGYEYWLFSYDPVWEIEISKALDRVTFFQRANNKVREFKYQNPISKGRVTDYAFVDKKDTLWVEILPDRCRDGKTEIDYARSAVVWWKDSVLTGCAVVSEEIFDQ